MRSGGDGEDREAGSKKGQKKAEAAKTRLSGRSDQVTFFHARSTASPAASRRCPCSTLGRPAAAAVDPRPSSIPALRLGAQSAMAARAPADWPGAEQIYAALSPEEREWLRRRVRQPAGRPPGLSQ
eukprot:maker-scaffold250_size238258-snap-gene-1.20 protein:Tk02992 transcript:maker-scaffold250_size238258-snap-gene-1.20-mRNA-1 annotation:"guanosine pentaphosphate phosphohydrolase"